MRFPVLMATVLVAGIASARAQLRSGSIPGIQVYQNPSTTSRQAGIYSDAVIAGNTVFLAGVGAVANSPIDASTSGVLGQLRNTLQALGGTMDNVVLAKVFLANVTDYNGLQSAWNQFFPNNPPARTTIQAANPAGSVVEIELTAYLPNGVQAPAPSPRH